MKAEELRIGNYYNSAKFKTLVRCEMADFSEIYQRAEGATPDESDIAAIFEPIPLTGEWLSKLGIEFEKALEGHIIDLQNENTLVVDDSEGKYYYQIGHGSGWTNAHYIDYVHQLQNLYFALTAKELTIKEAIKS